MPQQFLNSPDVVPRFQEMRRKRMAQRMATDLLVEVRPGRRFPARSIVRRGRAGLAPRRPRSRKPWSGRAPGTPVAARRWEEILAIQALVRFLAPVACVSTVVALWDSEWAFLNTATKAQERSLQAAET